MAQEPTTVYTEVQIDEDSISLTLISENENGVIVEDTERFTFDDLQSLSGDHSTLSLSGNTQEALSESARHDSIQMILDDLSDSDSQQSADLQVGDVVEDQNPPSWSNDPWVEVVEILQNARADEYVIDGPNEGKVLSNRPHRWNDTTVAEANPSYDEDETVVMAQYNGSGDWYAFPKSRLTGE